MAAAVLLQVAYNQRGEVQAVRYEVEAVAPQQANTGGCMCVLFFKWLQVETSSGIEHLVGLGCVGCCYGIKNYLYLQPGLHFNNCLYL